MMTKVKVESVRKVKLLKSVPNDSLNRAYLPIFPLGYTIQTFG
ncbi:hypothetical protein [Neobacillus drentensis]|nr:hypothetical protein [Neobacillus drentensis]